MPLSECKDCGKMLSTSADECPTCGSTDPHPSTSTNFGCAGPFLFVGFVLLLSLPVVAFINFGAAAEHRLPWSWLGIALAGALVALIIGCGLMSPDDETPKA